MPNFFLQNHSTLLHSYRTDDITQQTSSFAYFSTTLLYSVSVTLAILVQPTLHVLKLPLVQPCMVLSFLHLLYSVHYTAIIITYCSHCTGILAYLYTHLTAPLYCLLCTVVSTHRVIISRRAKPCCLL